MKIIRTVCGDIGQDQLGFTSMHDHTVFDQKTLKFALLFAMPGMISGATAYRNGQDIQIEKKRRQEEHLDHFPAMSVGEVIKSMKLPRSNPYRHLSDFEYYRNELKEFAKAGGRSLCDCSPNGKKTDLLQKLSRESGVQIISCIGNYTKPTIKKALFKNDCLEMRRILEDGITNGDGTCDGRPGFVKCAISLPDKGGEEVSTAEFTSVRLCAEAAKANGMSLHIHTAFPLRKQHVIKTADMLEKTVGISPDRVLFCHMDSFALGPGNPAACINQFGYDSSLAVELSERGYHIGLDTWSIGRADAEASKFHLNARKELLMELIGKGFRKNITLGHDMMSKANGIQNQNLGYTEFPEVLMKMKKEGMLSEEDIQAITITNPIEILTIQT